MCAMGVVATLCSAWRRSYGDFNKHQPPRHPLFIQGAVAAAAVVLASDRIVANSHDHAVRWYMPKKGSLHAVKIVIK